MANKTISVPDDVLPIIDGLDVPFSRWVTEQLRRHAAESSTPLARQFTADAALAEHGDDATRRRRSRKDAEAVGARMNRSAPW